ncbi:MAG: nucleotidyltransferase domain-containing protein [Melioribacteraceae bacterium]|nr:nucleotidyltransferase domain-containing protein [Melioribacteraceae bacterium]MCF8264001.1 nucleotidyltransferase domain-containing protein [Melioribacteraceae bacterium]MCF8412577.1 nucleotidyltransferase domain-containing protein [Melioribacteraceae bacterium]MCF8431044.1 nucleotidyltransferase domain-containing protein [Melioribacteraceae bacterium]
MDKRTVKVITDFTKLVRKKYSNLESAYVFGSYARGNFSEDSDIDIALIFNNLDSAARFDMQVQLILLASTIDTRIEPHPISNEDFNSENPFSLQIKNGIEIIESMTFANPT